MEGLTKQQIVLVTLLVSFVTSIATGIVTATLIGQAPAGVTQTINRVVERTIEKVVPSENKAAVITRETVVVKEDDLVVAALEKNQKTAIRIKKIEGVGENATSKIAGIGLVVSKQGHLIADSGLLEQKSDEAGAPIPQSFVAIFPDGTVVPLALLGADAARGVAVFAPMVLAGAAPTPAAPASTTPALPTFFPASLGDSDGLKLGQTVIGLDGEERNTVATGIISSFAPLPSGEAQQNSDTASTTPTVASAPTPKTATVGLIKTDFSSVESLSGALLLNLSGEVVGMKLGPATLTKNGYTPINSVTSAVTKIVEKTSPKKP